MFARLRLEVKEQYRLAALALDAYRKRDPTDPLIHFQLAEAYFGEGNTTVALERAEQARKLDCLVREPRKLTDQQRQQLEKWLAKEKK
jgi:hypothetical protein